MCRLILRVLLSAFWTINGFLYLVTPVLAWSKSIGLLPIPEIKTGAHGGPLFHYFWDLHICDKQTKDHFEGEVFASHEKVRRLRMVFISKKIIFLEFLHFLLCIETSPATYQTHCVCLSPPGVKLWGSKDWYVSNLVLYWNGKVDLL